MRMIILLFGLLAALDGYCQQHLPRPERVVATRAGAEPDPMTEACRGFSLTSKEALAYLEAAIIIDSFEEHDHYAWAPCWVRGTALINKQAVTWEIRAGLTARVVFPDGRVVLLADPSQRFSEED